MYVTKILGLCSFLGIDQFEVVYNSAENEPNLPNGRDLLPFWSFAYSFVVVSSGSFNHATYEHGLSLKKDGIPFLKVKVKNRDSEAAYESLFWMHGEDLASSLLTARKTIFESCLPPPIHSWCKWNHSNYSMCFDMLDD